MGKFAPCGRSWVFSFRGGKNRRMRIEKRVKCTEKHMCPQCKEIRRIRKRLETVDAG